MPVTQTKPGPGSVRAETADARYRAFFDNAQVGLGRSTVADGRIVEANSRLAEILGYDEPKTFCSEFVAAQRYVDPESRMHMLATLRKTGSVRNFETRLRRRDGTIAWVRLDAALDPERAEIDLVVTDLSEQKASEAALCASERRFRDFAQAASDWMWETDAEHRLTFVSEPARHTADAHVARVLGRTPWGLASVDDPSMDALWREHKATLDAHRPFRDFRYSFRDERGRRRHRSVSGLPVFDSAGMFRGYRGVTADITALEHRELDLAEKSAILDAILAHIDQGISLADKELNLLAFNRRFLELLEFPADRFQPGDPFEAFIRYNAERGEYGPGDVEEQVRARVQLAKRFEPHCFERTRPDGTVIEVRGRPLSGGGFVTTYTDVSALRQHEANVQAQSAILRGTLDNMAQGLVAFDPDLVILSANKRAEELLAVPTHMLVPGASFAEIIRDAAARGDYGPGDPEKLAATYIRLAKGQKAHQFERARPDGTILEIRGRRLPEGGFVVTYTDVTERKRNEEELRRVNAELAARSKELERSNAELEQFAYVASHDLQEPLRMVASYCQLLQRRYADKLDADANDFIAFAVDGAKRMQRLINDLLAYSRVGTRGQPLVPISCQDVFDEARQNLGALIAETEAIVTAEALPEVLGDHTQLVQLFQNLLGNALKFRNEGRPEVHVCAAREGADWCISVRDNGIGIEPQFAERIFMIFQRLHPAEEYPGTGIGLAVCKKIVERHNGRIWVESAPGGGSAFHVTLAARDPAHA